jgi:transposase
VEEISELKREGLSSQAISQLTGFDRKTIRKYRLKPEGRPVYGPEIGSGEQTGTFKPYLKERLQDGVWNAQVLLRELRQHNYTGGYTILTDWLGPQRESARVVAVRRFETPPGKQAQVDWGHLGSLLEAEKRAAVGLHDDAGLQPHDDGGSRHGSETGNAVAHARSGFQQWGSVPEEILYDRMKTVWTGTDERGEIVWNAVFLDFARYWGFTPRLCRP